MKSVLFIITTLSCLILTSFTLHNDDGNGFLKKDDVLKVPEIEWVSFDEAISKNKDNPKKIFVDIYTEWCTWCFKMDKATFTNPTIIEYINENFYPVKLDAEMKKAINFKNNFYTFRPNEGRRGLHEITLWLTRGRLSFPSVVFLDEGMNNPQPIPGFQNPVTMDKLLKYFGEDYYKQVDWGLFNQIYESPLEPKKMNINPTGGGIPKH